MKGFVKSTIFLITILFFLNFTAASAINVVPSIDFNVDKDYDADTRQKIPAILVQTSPNIYFYVEKKYWDSWNQIEKSEILDALNNLSYEFDSAIYPGLTSVFGKESRPGLDGDNKITVLFHNIKTNVTGYVRSADGYSKLQVPNSNEKEMVYLSVAQIRNLKLKEFLAHEFTHLIEFNQKDKIHGVQEEIWLSEARADYASTLLGYDNSYVGSNLQRRVKDFLERPDDSLTEWSNSKYDYAVVNLFTHYLVDHYGIRILGDSLKLNSTGIKSVNQALLSASVKENFSQIFTNWTITMIVNNCSINLKYCYLDRNLGNLRINPSLIFIPLTGSSSLSVTNFTKNWTGNWQKIVGGNGNLNLQFSSLNNLDFKVPYILTDKGNNQSVTFLEFDKNKTGEINIEDFNNQYSSLVVVSSLQNNTSGFNGSELTHSYILAVSNNQNRQDDIDVMQKLLAQIELLKKQIADLQNNSGNNALCLTLNSNLYKGISNRSAVSCLQQFLKSQGSDIYPEGLVTGFFGNLTKTAVINFQKKYNILQTGFVGILTREKINQLLNGR